MVAFVAYLFGRRLRGETVRKYTSTALHVLRSYHHVPIKAGVLARLAMAGAVRLTPPPRGKVVLSGEDVALLTAGLRMPAERMAALGSLGWTNKQ